MSIIIRSLFAWLIILLFGPVPALSQTCCWRNVGMEIIFPYDVHSKIYNDMGYIGTASG